MNMRTLRRSATAVVAAGAVSLFGATTAGAWQHRSTFTPTSVTAPPITIGNPNPQPIILPHRPNPFNTAPNAAFTYTVNGPRGLWVLPVVPSQATGCYSLSGARLPNGGHAPATWFFCSTGDHTFTFATNVSGAVVPIRYYYGYSRGGSISYSANPYAAVVLP